MVPVCGKFKCAAATTGVNRILHRMGLVIIQEYIHRTRKVLSEVSLSAFKMHLELANTIRMMDWGCLEQIRAVIHANL